MEPPATDRYVARSVLSACLFTLTSQRPERKQITRIERGRSRAEVPQQPLPLISDAMVRLGWDEDAVARPHFLRLRPHGHEAGALENEVYLLWGVTVDPLLAARLDLNQGGGEMLGLAGSR